MRYFFLLLIVQISCSSVNSGAICIENRRDFEILDHFFRIQFLEEEYGYVLEGLKPISVRNFYPLDIFPFFKDYELNEKEFALSILAQKATSIWNFINSNQKKFVLKAATLNNSDSKYPSLEVQFINTIKLQKTIQENIDLFHYVLGPGFTSQELVNKIAYSKEALVDILCNDHVLMGIVLGFGTYNSLMEGREDTIYRHCFSRDTPPLSQKSFLINSHEKSNLDFLTPERYGMHYLEMAGDGEEGLFRTSLCAIKPGLGFSNLANELKALNKKKASLPSTLKQMPAFIFSPYKGGKNKRFIQTLQNRQKKIQKLLKKKNFFETVLTKISGAKPVICCDKTPFSGSLLSLLSPEDNLHFWKDFLKEITYKFEDNHEMLSFIEAFNHPFPEDAPKIVGASKNLLQGLEKALENLATSETYFQRLSNDPSLRKIVENFLYVKINSYGKGKKLEGANQIKVHYLVEDIEGNILFADRGSWIDSSETIPGFAHGIQGMYVGERRTLFVHPKLAYGALTTLPPCIGLKIHVDLLDIEEKNVKELPALIPEDLTWIKNPKLYDSLKESTEKFPHFVGSFYGTMLSKIDGLDLFELSIELENLAKVDKKK